MKSWVPPSFSPNSSLLCVDSIFLVMLSLNRGKMAISNFRLTFPPLQNPGRRKSFSLPNVSNKSSDLTLIGPSGVMGIYSITVVIEGSETN